MSITAVPRHLDDRHRKVLEDRGIDRNIRDYRTVTEAETKDLDFVGDQCRAGMAFSSYDIHGAMRGTILRADEPRKPKGKPVKYDRKPGEVNWLDVPVSCRDAVLDVTIPLDIPESPMKADAMLTAGSRAAVGTHGCWGHKSTMADGVGKVICPDWAHIPLKGRKVRVAPDSDVRDNPNVQAGIRDLVRYLHGRGAEVSVVVLPHAADGSKQGVDDWLAAGGKYEDLAALEVSTVPGMGVTLPNPAMADPVADALLDLKWTDAEGSPTLLHFQDSWLRYDGAGWRILDDTAMQTTVRKILRRAVWLDERETGTEIRPWNPTISRVKEVLDAIRSVRFLPGETELGTWLDGMPDGAVGPFVAMQNGVLDIGRRELLPSSPRFLSLTTLPFGYDPEAKAPVLQGFMSSMWGTDDKPKQLIQEFFGYGVSGRTEMQKALYAYGPPRCGKGTFMRLLMELMGAANVQRIMAKTLAGEFGLETAIGKSLVVVPDARWNGDKVGDMVEKILSITGEDNPAIQRKFKPAYTGKNSIRFMFLSNDLPKVRDDSAAIVTRFVVLPFTVSFDEEEQDRKLGDKLAAELPGVLNWALDGLARLDQNGRFTETSMAKEIREEMEESASPMKAFIRAFCVTGADKAETTDNLYDAFVVWSRTVAGREHVEAKSAFIRALRSALPGISQYRATIGKERIQAYRGIALSVEGKKDLRRMDPNRWGGRESDGLRAAAGGETSPPPEGGDGKSVRDASGMRQGCVRDKTPENPRSEGVVRGRQGKSENYRSVGEASIEPVDVPLHIEKDFSPFTLTTPDAAVESQVNSTIEGAVIPDASLTGPLTTPDTTHKTGCRSTSSRRRSRKPSTKATDAAYIAGRICPVLSSLASRGVGRELAMFESPAFSWDFLLAADGVDVPPSKARPVLEELASRGLIEWEGSRGSFRVTPAGHQLAETLPPPLGAHAVLVGWDWNAA